MTDTTQTENTETAAPEAAPEAPVTLTLSDLQSQAMVIQAACERGAFKAAEYTQVGAVFDKLATFLKQSTPAPEAEEAAPETEAPSTPETEA